jgi:GR25 family glycosyltransferase involved in LPS biosynthesis
MKLKGVEKIFCVNLERRPDRRTEATNEFKKFDLEFEFFNATDGHSLNLSGKIKPGHIGCVLSHFNLFKHIRDNEDGEIFMITEDDVVFKDDFINTYNSLIDNVPFDWTLFYFGGNHNHLSIDFTSSNIHRLKNTYTTHCYLVKKSKIDLIIQEFDNDRIFNEEVDVHLSNVQRRYPCYGFYPSIAWQRDSFSDIEMRDVNYDFLK